MRIKKKHECDEYSAKTGVFLRFWIITGSSFTVLLPIIIISS